jgi:O-antigen/teichoic acid export membrane protein
VSASFVNGSSGTAAREDAGPAGRRGIRRSLTEPLARTSAALMASTLLGAVFGIGFWAVAARTYPVAEVGRDSALVAMLFALSGLGQLSLNNLIPRFLPQMRTRIGRQILISYACSAVASLAIGGLFVLIAPLASSRFAFVAGDPWLWILFPLSVAAWSIFLPLGTGSSWRSWFRCS